VANGPAVNPWLAAIHGLVSGAAPVITSSIMQKAEDRRNAIHTEAKALTQIIDDASGTYSQADRDAALFALAELHGGDKPGAGMKAFEKRRKELQEAQTKMAFGGVAGGGAVAGQPGGAAAPTPVIGGGETPEGKDLGPPGPPAPGKFAPLPAAGPGPQPASSALPATSPVVSRGTAASEGPPAASPAAQAPSGGPTGPAPMGGPQPPAGGPGGQPAAPGGPEEGPPGPEQIEAYGKSIGLNPPQRQPMPQQPNPYTARKLDLEFYKQDMLQFKSAEEHYADYLQRVGTLLHQERKQKETQDFQTKERLGKQEFESKENEKNRASREKAAKIRGAGATPAADKGAAAVRKTALAEYHRTLDAIEREKGEFIFGKLKPEEKLARKKAAAENYRAATGEDPPGGEGTPTPAPAKAKKPEGGPPEAPQSLDKVPNGAALRARIEEARRAKHTPQEICAGLDAIRDPQQRAASRAFARCP
jgi:hypothetical protein